MKAHIEYSLLKLSKHELTRLVLDYQVKLDDVLNSAKGDTLKMKKAFTKLFGGPRLGKILLIGCVKRLELQSKYATKNEQCSPREGVHFMKL